MLQRQQLGAADTPNAAQKDIGTWHAHASCPKGLMQKANMPPTTIRTQLRA
ncbi:hypothetical protein HMPREF0670_00194 [Prevotella sp. oral taxon 317 str. F0108]|nr:hypothetical protein HMPREF0670_00194 [Prevotella sp. oral taxon 317 str. F0108]